MEGQPTGARRGRREASESAGFPAYVSCQRIGEYELNELVGRMKLEAHRLATPEANLARVLSAPDGPLAELTIDSLGCARLRLSSFSAVVMGEYLDISMLAPASRSLPLPEFEANEDAKPVRLFLEVRYRRVCIDPKDGRTFDVSDSDVAPMRPDLRFREIPKPFLAAGSAPEGGIEIARLRFDETGKPELEADFAPIAATLGSVPATRRAIAARLAPMFDSADQANGLLAERDDLMPALRWKLAALATSGREMRRALADHGLRLPDAYRLIANALDELLRATGTAQAGGEPRWPEEVWATPHLIPDALVLDDFLDAANAILAEATGGWIQISPPALRVEGAPAAAEFLVELNRSLGKLIEPKCRRLRVEVRAEVALGARGSVSFHPWKSRDRLVRPFSDIPPLGLRNGAGFGFAVPLKEVHSPAVAGAGSEAEAAARQRRLEGLRSEILESSRIRFACPVECPAASAGAFDPQSLPGLVVSIRGEA